MIFKPPRLLYDSLKKKKEAVELWRDQYTDYYIFPGGSNMAKTSQTATTRERITMPHRLTDFVSPTNGSMEED